MLQSQLYGKARDICKSVSDTDIQSDNGSQAIIIALYKRDSLSVVSEVYQCFTKLLSLKRGSNESVKTFNPGSLLKFLSLMRHQVRPS